MKDGSIVSVTLDVEGKFIPNNLAGALARPFRFCR